MKPLALSILLALPTTALAQPTSAVLSWQFSQDLGSTWIPDSIAVPSGTTTPILVRAMVAWQSHTSTFDGFGGMNLDAFVARTPGSGTGDWILNPLTRNNGGLQSRPDVGVLAFPDLLKIDRLTDVLPPGLGTGWVSPGQIPNFEGFSTANPIEIITYSYLLDGTAGIRTVSASVAARPDGTNAAFFDLDFGSTPQFVPLTHHPATITVIPAPPAATLAILSLGGLASRRRR